MNLSTSVFVYVGSIVLYKRIVNANTQSIRIANADGQGNPRIATVERDVAVQINTNLFQCLLRHYPSYPLISNSR